MSDDNTPDKSVHEASTDPALFKTLTDKSVSGDDMLSPQAGHYPGGSEVTNQNIHMGRQPEGDVFVPAEQEAGAPDSPVRHFMPPEYLPDRPDLSLMDSDKDIGNTPPHVEDPQRVQPNSSGQEGTVPVTAVSNIASRSPDFETAPQDGASSVDFADTNTFAAAIFDDSIVGVPPGDGEPVDNPGGGDEDGDDGRQNTPPEAFPGTNEAVEDGPAVTGQLVATDIDGDDLSFSLVDGPSEGTAVVNADGSYSFDPGADFQDLGVGETRDVTFSYQVDDGQGGIATEVVTVTVEGTNDAPIASPAFVTAVEDGPAVTGQLVATDIDGDDLSFSLVDGPAEGTAVVNADGSYSFDPGADFQDLGVGETRDVTFSYQVDDGQGGIATEVVTVTVEGTNDAPIASPAFVTAVEDGPAVIGQLVATDIDGDDLSFSLVDGPSEGTAVVNADGSYSFDPGADFQDLGVGETRDVTFSYQVDDGQGGTAIETVTVTVEGTNDAPIASPAFVSAVEDGPAVTGQLLATDIDGDDLSFSLVDGPAEGSVTVNADGSYSFDPGADFQDLGVGETRDVTFSYQVDDGQGGTATEVVTVTVEGTNDAPIASPAFVSAVEDGPAVIGQLVATDIDGDDLSFSLVDGPSEGTAVVNADGSYSFDPGADFQDLGVGETRDVTFSYQVDDGHGGTATETVTVTVEGTNDAPIASPAFITAVEDGPAVIGQLVAMDLDGDDLSFSLVDGPSEGTAVVNADGSYSFDPGSDFQDLGVGETRDVTFSYQVDDGHGGTATEVVTVTVEGTNDAPVASPAFITAVEDGPAVIGQLVATDIDGDDLSFSLVDGPAEGSVTVNADGSYSFDPGSDFQDLGVGETRDVTFSYQVDDGQGGTATETVWVTVEGTNDAPEPTGSGSASVSNVIVGSDRSEIIFGTRGDDAIFGGGGRDWIFGGAGNDHLFGGAGNDFIFGGSGDDVISGGAGNDWLFGGAGNDIFLIGEKSGHDRIDGGRGWSDGIDISAAVENGQGWTMKLSNGEMVESVDVTGTQFDITDGLSGTIRFDDGTKVDFTNIESIFW